MLTPPATLPRVLLTGFDPFGGDSVNPSWLAVSALEGRRILKHRVVAARLPTEFDLSLQILKHLMSYHRPKIVICVGQAGGRNAMGLERVAINVNDARIPDNAGQQPIDTPVVARGPAAYFSTLPLKAMAQDLRRAGLSVEMSQSAGTFVCNHVFYGLMHTLASRKWTALGVRGGFVHVPWLPDQGTPSMPLADMVRGLELGVRCALRHQSCGVLSAQARSGGALH
ncbi:MAG: pyroglutamyl-peptidase [Pseudomonadota bacterium]|jgi:pyroglutamyl-peptidase